MTQDELRRLEMNLTKSDTKAKPGYVRCKLGYLAEDQGFSPVDNLPIFNRIQNKETTIAEFIEDVGHLNERYIKLQHSLTLMEEHIKTHIKQQTQREQEFQANLNGLKEVINALLQTA